MCTISCADFKEKSFVIFFSFLLTLNLAAQQSNICKVYASLVKESQNGFVNLADKLLEGDESNKKMSSRFNLDKSSFCYIEMHPADTSWCAQFGVYKNLDSAKARISALRSSFSLCDSALEFIADTASIYHSNYRFKETIEGGVTYYKGELGIYMTINERYIPFLRIPQKAAPVTLLSIPFDADTSFFAKSLGALIPEAENGFKLIIGSRISTDMELSAYNTTFCLPNAFGCDIIETPSAISYEAFYALNIDSSAADTELQKIADAVASALGKGYVWQLTERGIGFTASHLAGFNSHPTIEVSKQNGEGDKINLVLSLANKRWP